jgi:hypothetical protein
MLPTVKANMMMTFWLAATSAASQNPDWSILMDANDRIANARQVVETPDGLLLLCGAFGDDSSQTHVLRLSASGALLSSRRIFRDMRRAGFVDIASLPGTPYHDFAGIVQDTSGMWGIARYRFNHAGEPIDSLVLPFPNTTWISFDNVLRLSSGTLVVPAARTATNDSWPFTRMRLTTFTDEGDSLSSLEHWNPWNIMLPRGIAEIAPDTFVLATDAGFPQLDQFGEWGSFTEFSTDLSPITGFGQVIVTGAVEPTFQNTLTWSHSVSVLPSDDLILSGRYRNHAAVARTSRHGQLQSVFIPDTVPALNFPGVLGGTTMLENGKLLFTFHQGLITNINDPYWPDSANVVKVYQLDTLLNLECVLTLDGHAENVHYWVNRAVATSDGGFILLGGRMDFNEQPRRWRYWAQKYAAGACFTGFEAHEFPAQVRAFPNPGSTEVNFCLNGPERGAYVEMIDLQGRIVGSTLFRMGQARLDAGEWPAGLYGYRVMGGDGTPLSAGRWVKE